MSARMSAGARTIALALGGAMLVGGGLLVWRTHGGGFGPVGVGLAIVLSVVFEGRYRGADAEQAPTGPGWQTTGETFRDEESGYWVKVWYNSASGERRYVPIEAPGSA